MNDHAQSNSNTADGESVSASGSGHSDQHAEDIESHIRVYFIVFGALAVLTVLTVAVGYLGLPIVPAVIVGLAIATVKGGLVAGYFMHLITEKQVIYVVLIFTFLFVLGMLILMSSSIYVHRAGVA